MKYTGINIGPIVKTLGLARKPRELWAASFLFSDLMQYIIREVPGNVTIISPAVCEQCSGVGLYPDRLFMKGELSDDDAVALIDKAWSNFNKDVFSGTGPRNYFSIMNASVEVSEDYEAIKELNRIMNILELNVAPVDGDTLGQITQLLKKTYGSPLFTHGLGSKTLKVDSLDEIAKVSYCGSEKKSYHNYFCVVQADGDNVGTYLTSESLKDNMPEVSKALLAFGLKAKGAIEEFGGMPVYAGGDDLLFIAPVVGADGRTTIFDLLANIDDNAFADVRKYISGASLSFGVSINYVKHPLYEALSAARTLLDDVAKNVSGKRAVAWVLQKHSGEQFKASFSRNTAGLWDEFMGVVEHTTDGNTVSAVAHKIREFAPLVERTLASESRVRLDALFEKVFEMKNNEYFFSVKEIMPTLYEVCKGKYPETLYAILRTAKFVKGEEPIDE